MYGIFGAGGCGRGLMPILRQELADRAETVAVFVDDRLAGTIINGVKTLSLSDFCHENSSERYLSLAVADPAVRRNLAQQCIDNGIDFHTIRANNIVIMDEVEIGVGAMLSPFVTLTSNIKIGRHFHANLYSYIEHDCEIGDFVTFAPGAKCNGNVVIEDGAYIGSGAVIKQGQSDRKLRIGEGAVVGMGAVVIRDVPAGTTVAGNPARQLKSIVGSLPF